MDLIDAKKALGKDTSDIEKQLAIALNAQVNPVQNSVQELNLQPETSRTRAQSNEQIEMNNILDEIGDLLDAKPENLTPAVQK